MLYILTQSEDVTLWRMDLLQSYLNVNPDSRHISALLKYVILGLLIF